MLRDERKSTFAKLTLVFVELVAGFELIGWGWVGWGVACKRIACYSVPAVIVVNLVLNCAEILVTHKDRFYGAGLPVDVYNIIPANWLIIPVE